MTRRSIHINPILLLTLPLLLLLSGCLKTTNYSALPENMHSGRHAAARTIAAGDSLLVATYNIYLGADIDLAINDLQNNERLAAVDILLLQEVDPAGADQIAKTLGMDYIYWPSFLIWRTERLFGNAVLSRWPIVDQMAADLPHKNPIIGIRRVAVAADIVIDAQQLRVVNVHLSTSAVSQDKRLEQAATVIDSLATTTGPIIIGGDFNTATESDRILMRRLMRKAGFRQLRLPPGPTASSVVALTGLDLILDGFFYRNLTAGASGIDRRAETSDHYPVWGVFGWPAPE